MSRFLVVALLAALASTAQPAHAATGSLADLKHRLQLSFAASTARTPGVAVDIDGIGAVYRSQSGTALAPASTEKLFTVYAALRVLGPTVTYTTRVVATRPQAGSGQPGNLWLIGVGDPSLATADLDHLAAAVAATGIRKLGGHLYVDDYRYDRSTRGPGWKPEFVPTDTGPLSALAVDSNGWRKDSAYVADPALANLGRFRALLAKRGITVSATLYRGPAPAGYRVVASHRSRPLATLVKGILKNSDNLGAELLVKELGKVRRGVGSTAQGAAVVRDTLHGMGVTVGTVADGSGLSNQDRQTVNGELSLLASAERGSLYAPMRAALPIACTDGTLEKRMCGTAAAGVVDAKTGTLDVVHSLAGWTTTRDGRPVRFAFLLQSSSSGAKANAAIDAAAVALSGVNLS